jgi:hypothetical protein
MTTDAASIVRPPNFYAPDLYVDDLDYTTIEDAELLPSLDARLLQSIAEGVISCVAAVAVAGTMTLGPTSPATIGSSAVTEPAAVARKSSDEPDARVDLRLMTERMRERSGLAARLFQRTPHPGADERDPDYEF